MAQFMSSVGFSSTFPFLSLFVRELGCVTSLGVELMTGLVFAGPAFTMMIASPFWGNLADRHGRKIMVVRACFGGALLITLMGFVRSAEELVLLKLIQGAVTGVIAANNALVASCVPRERAGHAMGMLQIAMAAGIALGPLLGGVVADLWGYRSAFWVTGGALFVSGVVVWLGVDEVFTPAAEAKTRGRGIFTNWSVILHSEGVAITYAMRFITQMGRAMLIPVLPLFLIKIIDDPANLNTFTGLVIGVGAVFVTISAAWLGRLGDGIGHRRILIVSMLSTGFLFALLSLCTQGWQFLAVQVALGAALGGLIPSATALLACYTRPGQEGKVYGLDNSITAAARTIGPLIAVGFTALMGIPATFVFIGVLSLVAGLAAWAYLPKSNLASG
jgi:DHA1 family multidrug resistance protein-like MFS transporter